MIILIFINSKIIIFKIFNEKMLKHSNFAQNFCLLIFDEIHLIFEWKNFRSKYYNFDVFRVCLFDDIFFLKTSTTLNSKTLFVVRNRCDFDENTIIMKTNLNRSKIFIQIICFQHSMINMFDLQFFFSLQISNAQNIFKIIVFMNFIVAIKKTCNLMKTWMNQLNYSINVSNLIFFFSNMIIKNKKKINTKFEMFFDSCKNFKILITIDVYELKIDNSNVKRIIQWLIFDFMTKLY